MENIDSARNNGNNTEKCDFALGAGDTTKKGAHKEGEEKRAEQMTEKDIKEVRNSTNKTEDMADVGQVGEHDPDSIKRGN